ncbi:MAG: hypothetical protein EDM79_10910 [Chloroflexi bacterium]|nr:MAG: hypothetical protein EDM79_10910 [Chloroflexota bacterium]
MNIVYRKSPGALRQGKHDGTVDVIDCFQGVNAAFINSSNFMVFDNERIRTFFSYICRKKRIYIKMNYRMKSKKKKGLL